MNQIYTLLVGIHIFAAILGAGPLLLSNVILKSAKDLSELKYAHQGVEKLNKAATIGWITLLPTGLLMGWINPSLFRMLWFDTSIALFVVFSLYSEVVIGSKMKTLHELIKTCESEEIPQQYKTLSSKLAPYDWFGKLLVVAIILLMVFKP
ncbi:DUF2269 family protein [Paenibacillus glucanolyticus]|uniref:DUF2269 family protein n=1 Tax=Paenibacillus glucanolyticus TaxID=59843 RepID=UPI00096E21A1|nr:DUF2269 family protein [Paenibacillus glucanolyticus]OMF76291.1 hypothetical protein BK142_14975 [Paenibacillus glucanolyticus]